MHVVEVYWLNIMGFNVSLRKQKMVQSSFIVFFKYFSIHFFQVCILVLFKEIIQYVLFHTKFINLSAKSWFLVHCVSQRARPINCIFMYCVVVSNNFCCSLTLMTYPPTMEPQSIWSSIHIFATSRNHFYHTN